MRRRTGMLVAGVVLAVAAVGAGVIRGRSSHGGNPDLGLVAAYDLRSGALRFAAEARTASVHVHALGSGTVVVTGADRCDVYPYEHDAMYALSLGDGALRWRRAYLDACFDYGAPTPTTDGIVAVQTRRGLQGWDARTGTTRWTEPKLQGPTASSTTVMTVNSNTGAVAFLDGRSGRPRVTSRAPFKPTAWLLTPTVAVLVTQSDSSVPGWKQRLTAIEIASGRRLWQRTLGRFYELGGPPGDDRVVLLSWPTSNTTSTQQAFDVRSGRRLWRRAVPQPFTIEGEASGAGLALFHDATGITALDLRTGRERWHVAGQGQIVVGQGSVAVIGDTVRMLDARTGALRWTRPLPATHARFGGSAAIGAGMLVVAASSPSFKPYTE